MLAARLGEWLRRAALGATAALITARAYWPSEIDLKSEAGSGLYWALAMLLVTGLAIASSLVGGRLRIRWSWADAAVMVLMLLYGVSAGHAAGRRPAINLAWEWGAVGMAYLLVRNLPRTRGESSILAAGLLATAFAVSSYGLYQVGVELPATRTHYLTHREATLRMLGIAPDSPAQGQFEKRLLASNEPMSTFALTNSLAGFLVGPLVLGLGLGWEALRQGKETSPGKKRGGVLLPLAVALLPLLVILGCLLLTKSRSAYVGLAVGMAAVAWRRGRAAPRKLAIALAGIAIVISGLVAAGVATHRLDREVFTEAGKSLRYRQEYWIGAWRAINESSQSFWQGYGPGNFGAAYLRHKLPSASEDIVDPHNLFLEVWATSGVWACLALAAALGIGVWSLFGPSCPATVPADSAHRDDAAGEATRRAEPAAPPRKALWLLACSGAGWLAVLLVGNGLFEGDFFHRWVLLGGAWLWAVVLGFPLWQRLVVPADLLGAAVLATVVNLLAAGGIGISSVALALWLLLALGLNLRDDNPCGWLRNLGGRLAGVALAVIWAALLGIFVGAVWPFWESEAAINEAESLMKRDPPAFEAAREAFDRAIGADHYSSRPFLGEAYLALLEWQQRGSRPLDLRWKEVPVLLTKACTPPRNANAWWLHRERARAARDLLKLLGDGISPSDSIKLRATVTEAARTASLRNPTSALLHAELAEASAEIGMPSEAAREAKEALRLDRLTPHDDRRLPPRLRSRLESALPEWETAPPVPLH